MANTKKQKNSLIIMIVAIVLAIAAIAYVVLEDSRFIENEDFAFELSTVLKKPTAFITEEDLAEFKFAELSFNAEENEAYLALAGEEFAALYKDFYAAQKAGDEEATFDAAGKFKEVIFELDADTVFDDIKYFTGLEVLYVSGIKFTDSSVFSGMTELTHSGITSCNLTEVAGLANLNGDNVVEIDLSGNTVEDWSALDYIKDKVLVNKYYTFEPTEDGTIDFENMTLVEQTLAEYYEELAAAEEAEKAEAEEAEAEESEAETTEETAETAE